MIWRAVLPTFQYEDSNYVYHKYMKEHENEYVAVVEKHTLDGANTFALTKHKRIRHMYE